MAAFIDITGQRFGRWLIVRRGQTRNKKTFWFCRCDCGVEREVESTSLKCGHTKSCGCLNLELIIVRETTHGMTDTPLHRIWRGLRSRCNNPNNSSYKNYGGRGIKVCERWDSFELFYEDMNKTYKSGLSIERINNDGNYEPKNCKWIPITEQSKNRRNAKIWSFGNSPISTNTSGIRGVSWVKSKNKWVATICINRKQKNLGYFDTKEEARKAYENSANRRSIYSEEHN